MVITEVGNTCVGKQAVGQVMTKRQGHSDCLVLFPVMGRDRKKEGQ